MGDAGAQDVSHGAHAPENFQTMTSTLDEACIQDVLKSIHETHWELATSMTQLLAYRPGHSGLSMGRASPLIVDSAPQIDFSYDGRLLANLAALRSMV